MKIKYTIIIILALFFANCSEDLDVDYKNNTDRVKLMENPDDVKGVASSLFFNWYKAQYFAYTFSPVMAMWTMADQGTASWTNGGMFDLSSEPREAFNNSEEYSWKFITQTYYEKMYANLSQTNDILKTLNKGMEIGKINEDGKGDETGMVRAFCYFNQGITLGYLGLVFDKAFITTEFMDENNLTLVETSDYKTVVDSAVVMLERCIEVCDNDDFMIPDSWINGTEYSNTELSELAHSFIARLLTYRPRTAAENNDTDWAIVLKHALLGIKRDLAPFMDNVTWYNHFYNYTFNNLTLDWCGVDARIIHLMDNEYPEVYPDLSIYPVPDRAHSDDLRLATDFRYDGSCPLKADRGYYHFFNYEYKRYRYSYDHPDEVIDFSVTENSLIIAEAEYRLGNIPIAKTIINAGTRTTRGFLDEITDDNKVLDALFYERDIELMMTGMGTAFFDMRRRDMLQKGTPLHFPIPAKELNVMVEPIYTFGGVENADGINTSNGGWKTTTK